MKTYDASCGTKTILREGQVPTNGFAADHGSILSRREGRCGVRLERDVVSNLLRLVDKSQADPRLLSYVPAYGGIELGYRFWVLPLVYGHAVSEARRRA